MKVSVWLSLALPLAGCVSKPAQPVFPAVVSGGWELKTSGRRAMEDEPDSVRKTGVRECWRANYAGAGSADVDVYALPAPELGLHLVQQWRPAADTVVWYTSRYFIVVNWQGSDRSAAGALIRGLQKQFSGGS